MKILAFFTNSGSPATGLSPTIRIRDLSDNSLVVTDAAMTEAGDGHYQYDHVGYDADKNYAIRCDGTATLAAAERYTSAGNENYIEDIEGSSLSTDIGSLSTDIKRVLGLLHENIYIDEPIYDGDNNLTSARIRIYSDAVSVGTANNVIGTYEITSPGDSAGRFTTWKQIKS